MKTNAYEISLSPSEEKSYNSIFSKITAQNTKLSRKHCLKLMINRGGVASETANKVIKKNNHFVFFSPTSLYFI